MERTYHWVAQRRVLGASFLMMVLAVVGFAWFDRARSVGTPGVVELELAFTAVAFGDIVAQWGTAGVRAYRMATLLIDYWFPIVYSVFLASLIALLTMQADRDLTGAFVLPFLAAALDWIENTLHLVLLRDPGHISARLVLTASVAAAAKFGFIGVSILVAVYLLAANVRRTG
jgi:hypothetical protein